MRNMCKLNQVSDTLTECIKDVWVQYKVKKENGTCVLNHCG